MKSDVLTEKNYLLFCAKHYENIQCTSNEEFISDLQRIKYLKKLITRYIESGELKERLILNHLIILNNVFGPEILCKILFLKMENYMTYLKPFLILLNVLPDKVYDVKETNSIIDTTIIPLDQNIIKVLRKI